MLWPSPTWIISRFSTTRTDTLPVIAPYASTATAIIAHADVALLTAKREGRDRLIIASKPDEVVDESSWAAG
jgi:hypothetical protein